MKKRTIIILTIMAALIAFFLTLFFLLRKDDTDSLEVSNVYQDMEAEDSFYIKRADANICFNIKNAETESLVVRNSNGKIVNTIITEEDDFITVSAPEGGYSPGEEYVLILPDGATFDTEELKGARQVSFSIAREAVEEYSFADNVVEAAESISFTTDGKVILGNNEIKEGDILFGQDENGEYHALRILKIADGAAEYNIPGLDEVYQQLNICGEYEWDVNSIILPKDAEMQLAEEFKGTDLFNALMLAASAAEFKNAYGDGIDIEVKTNSKDNSITVTVTLSFIPGLKTPDFEEIKESKNNYTTVSVTFSETIGFSTDCDIKSVKNWDVSTTLHSKSSVKIDLEYKNPKVGKDTEIVKRVDKLIESLNSALTDSISGAIPLAEVKIPVSSIPGLYFSTEVKLFADLSLTAKASMKTGAEYYCTVGFRFKDSEFSTYNNFSKTDNGLDISIIGKVEAKTGLRVEFKAVFVNEKLCSFEISPEGGAYFTGYLAGNANFSTRTSKPFSAYGYAEIGVYVAVNLKANLNLAVADFRYPTSAKEKLIEKKYPIIELGDKTIPLRIYPTNERIAVSDGKIHVPEIVYEYYDISGKYTCQKELNKNELLYFRDGGKELKIDREVIVVPPVEFSNGFTVYVEYVANKSTTLKCDFMAKIPSCKIEGTVLKAARDETTSVAPSTEVALYSKYTADGKPIAEPVATTETDENGTFSFEVIDGDYLIVANKDQYLQATLNFSIMEKESKNIQMTLTPIPERSFNEVINSENCALVEQGMRTQYDLNGDGIKDEIYFFAPGDYYQAYGSIDTERLIINNIDYSDSVPEVDCGTPHYCILDIDRTDGLLEIGVMDYGPSDDDHTHILRYCNDSVYEIGSFEGTFESVGFGETKCNGDGSITTYKRLHALQTWFGIARYKVEGEQLVEIVPNLYEAIPSFGINKKINIIKEFPAYYDMNPSSEPVMIPAGGTIVLLRTDDDEWVECEAYGKKLYLRTPGYGLITDGENEIYASEVFANLCFAD